MKISSPAFQDKGQIPAKYTCDGDNVNPPLNIEEVPQNTKSLALMVDDPDAPAAAWTHWTLWNISPETKEIAENNVPPEAIEGITSFGNTGYGGPCPPSGSHHYHFKLYALNSPLELPQKSKKSDLEEAIEDKVIAKAELMGIYSRG